MPVRGRVRRWTVSAKLPASENEPRAVNAEVPFPPQSAKDGRGGGVLLTSGVDDFLVREREAEQREDEDDVGDDLDPARAALPIPLLDKLDEETPEEPGEEHERNQTGEI